MTEVSCQSHPVASPSAYRVKLTRQALTEVMQFGDIRPIRRAKRSQMALLCFKSKPWNIQCYLPASPKT